MSYYYYGIRVALLLGVSVAASVLTDSACVLLRGRAPNIRDFSPFVTGLIIPLMAPASVPLPVIIFAVVFAILVAKHPFGGAGYNIFNPAAAGIAFAAICFPADMFSFPIPLEELPLFPGSDLVVTNSPAFTLHLGGIPNYDWVEMSRGNFPGAMGTTHILVILACLLYLLLRGAARWQLPAVFLATFCGLCWLFPRAGLERTDSLLMEVMSGSALFGGVFMLTDPVTSPKRGWSQALYAASAAMLLMLFRRFGSLEEDFVFVLLLMNASSWMFDLTGEKVAAKLRARQT
jgi:electron transport complex protein RnfD